MRTRTTKERGRAKRAPKQETFGFARWGGKRRGAGRKPQGERAGVSHAKRPEVAARHPVLVTVKLAKGLASLRTRETHAVVREAIARATGRFEFRVVEYSVQRDHVHMIAESKSAQSLTRGMRGLTTRIARALNRSWERAGRVFADRYHARILRTPREVRNALVYVVQNARKHGVWSSWKACDPFSSARWFDGWRERPPELRSILESSFLSKARTWLLSRGWRRHGLIRWQEVPAV